MTTVLSIFILKPDTIASVFMRFRVVSSAYCEIFNSYIWQFRVFLILIPLLFISFLILIAIISVTGINKSPEKRNPCFSAPVST